VDGKPGSREGPAPWGGKKEEAIWSLEKNSCKTSTFEEQKPQDLKTKRESHRQHDLKEENGVPSKMVKCNKDTGANAPQVDGEQDPKKTLEGG